ncbi:protein kinase domain-containing protein [Streptomyces sp. NPDC003015]
MKPSNVLLAPDPSGAADRRVLLTDYGISLWPRETRVTRSGMVVGTPGYLAPERLSGGEATEATDLFWIGATLSFAVEGASPFERDTLDASLMAALTAEPAVPQRASDPLSRQDPSYAAAPASRNRPGEDRFQRRDRFQERVGERLGRCSPSARTANVRNADARCRPGGGRRIRAGRRHVPGGEGRGEGAGGRHEGGREPFPDRDPERVPVRPAGGTARGAHTRDSASTPNGRTGSSRSCPR